MGTVGNKKADALTKNATTTLIIQSIIKVTLQTGISGMVKGIIKKNSKYLGHHQNTRQQTEKQTQKLKYGNIHLTRIGYANVLEGGANSPNMHISVKHILVVQIH